VPLPAPAPAIPPGAAISDVKIAPASRSTWAKNMEIDPAGTEATLAGMRKNTIPASALGRSDANEERDVLYDDLFGEPH
jgi:hypothetical protein